MSPLIISVIAFLGVAGVVGAIAIVVKDFTGTKAEELNIPMKIVDAHYAFDRSRMVVTSGAEGRVDFRPLIHVPLRNFLGAA